MTEEKRCFSLFGLLALLGFFVFLSFVIWQMRQAPIITPEDIKKARDIAARLP
jgi:hypothetical protein